MSHEGASPSLATQSNKPTYHVLSNAITKAVESTREEPLLRVKAFQALIDQLFVSPRLTQWAEVGTEFRLFTAQEDICVCVSEKKVWLTKGIRHYDIIDGLSATTLYKSIAEAQAIVQPFTPKTISEAEQEEYFADQNSNGADLDAALLDSPVYNRGDDEEIEMEDLFPKVNPAPGGSSEEEDEELLAEIESDAPDTGTVAVAELEKVEAKAYQIHATAQIHSNAPVVVEKFGVNAGVEPGGYLSKINRKAAAETAQVNIEYDDSKYLKDRNPVKDTPRMETTRVTARLKSLQGRMLNIVEAALGGGQLEAVKILINKEFRREINFTNGASWNGHTDED